jgi:hypothetical protein
MANRIVPARIENSKSSGFALWRLKRLRLWGSGGDAPSKLVMVSILVPPTRSFCLTLQRRKPSQPSREKESPSIMIIWVSGVSSPRKALARSPCYSVHREGCDAFAVRFENARMIGEQYLVHRNVPGVAVVICVLCRRCIVDSSTRSSIRRLAQGPRSIKRPLQNYQG